MAESKSIFLTVDGGTTNTRITLVKNGEIRDTVKLPVGAGRGRDALAAALKEAIPAFLEQHGLRESDVTSIIASGMITSEYGLCRLEHLVIPAGVKELHDGMHETVIDEITSIPFVFIRGVKTACRSLADADMMRGEETELFGLIDPAFGDCVYVLPGSHSKLIRVDERGRIVAFSTMLTGEMNAVLAQNTILRDAVDIRTSELDADYLQKGYEACLENGLNHTLFRVRILKNLFGAEPSAAYSFYLGAVLCGEIEQIRRSGATTVVLGGQKHLRRAMATLLESCSAQRVILLSDETVSGSTAVGAMRIYRGTEE